MKRSVALLLVLGACVSAPKRIAPPVIAPRPSPPPAPVLPPVAWEDRARTPGNWVYRRDEGISSARFVAPNGLILFTMSCSATTDMRLFRPGAEALRLHIETTTGSRDFMGSPDALDGGGIGSLRVADPFLDAIIYSRGKFLVAATGQPDLILPPWPEVARVVEDCRR